jgi:hypothetical protein
MREVSGTTLAKLNGKEPVQPYLKVWTTFGTFTDLQEGGILEVGNLDSIQSISGAGQTGTISIKLDDTDDSLKNTIDSRDIHKTAVKIYQSFVEVEDDFLLFLGVVCSPVVWSEGERTLSFDVVSRLEDNEVGFAPEDGIFNFVSEDMIGKAWPLAFGKNKLVPLSPLSRAPSAILKTPFGFPDPGLYEQIARLKAQRFELQRQQQIARANAALYAFYAGLAGAAGDDDSSDTYAQMSVEQQNRI